MATNKEITVETERLLIIRRRYQALEEWCHDCRELVLMVRPDQAAALSGKTLRAIFTDIENGRVHFCESPDGMLLICLNTILQIHPRT